jgi:hypothetical protein
MGVHAYHEELEGFDSNQIWYDGCEECEHRSQNLPSSLGYLDNNNLLRAISRTKDWMDNGPQGRISKAELPLLRTLEAFMLIQQRLGFYPIKDGLSR